MWTILPRSMRAMLTVMITLSDHFSLLVLNLSGLSTTSVKPPTPSIWNMTCGIKHMIISVGFYVPFNNKIFRNINKRSCIQCIEKVVKIAIFFVILAQLKRSVLSHQNVKFISFILYQCFFSWVIIWDRGLWLSPALFENCGNCGGRDSHQVGWSLII